MPPDGERQGTKSSAWRLEQTRQPVHERAVGLVSSRASGRRIDAGRVEPGERLSPVVETLWWGSWDLRGQPPHTTELLGDPCVHLVFERGRSRVVGVWTRLWTRTLQGQGSVRAVKFRAGAATALVPCDAHVLSNRLVPLAQVLEDVDVAAIEHAVLSPADPAEGLGELSRWLEARLRRSAEIDRAVRVVRRITQAGVGRVDELALDAAMTVRAVQRLFRRHVGASPKQVIRRLRLQQAARCVERGDAQSLADLALSLGYADQAHLARDFRAATGRSLRSFERRLDEPP